MADRPPPLVVRPFGQQDRAWAEALLTARWGSTIVVSRGRPHDLLGLPGFVAEDGGVRAGLATYRLEAGACELTSLDAVRPHRGAGSVLLAQVRRTAARAGCRRLWLITTNDNLGALRFYQRRGLRLAAVHCGALALSRQIKPQIPEIGEYGIPLRDEIELEASLAEETP